MQQPVCNEEYNWLKKVYQHKTINNSYSFANKVKSGNYTMSIFREYINGMSIEQWVDFTEHSSRRYKISTELFKLNTYTESNFPKQHRSIIDIKYFIHT